MNRPVIVCGLGRVGHRIVEHLVAARLPVIVISLNEPSDPLPESVTFLRGDCRRTELLEQAGLKQARGVIIVTSDDLVNVTTAMLVRRLHPQIRIVVRMFNQNLIQRLGHTVSNTVALSVSALTAPLVALTALTGDTLGAFHLQEHPQQLAEIVVPEGSQLNGRKLSDVAAQSKILILSHARMNAEPALWSTVPSDLRLAPGDRFVACGAPDALVPLLDEGQRGVSGVRWAGWIRRQLRTARRTFAEIDLPVRIVSICLFSSLFLSTLVFRFGLNYTWAEGLFQTVSIIATGSDLPNKNFPDWAKIFVSILKIAGAALIAGFTAIFTQYLIRVKLGTAFEARRIPDSGHVVVCGLGNVGFRCVEELVRLGQQVVAIEQITDNAFAATIRRMAVPVIVGDATVMTVLNQAKVGTARAVIAATESELSNLEIALLVRETAPNQRVVVRLTDPTFAETVREAADIRLAVSIPALAAPAFAAALFGDRVQTLLTVGTRTLAVVELVVQEEDPCLAESSLVSAMIDYRFLPIGIAGRLPFAFEGLPKMLRLKPNDKLTVVTELSDMERLMRRQPAKADQQVIVDSYPFPARDSLLSLVRTLRQLTQEEAVQTLAEQPFVLAVHRTQGQAVELMSQLQREKVQVRVEPMAASKS